MVVVVSLPSSCPRIASLDLRGWSNNIGCHRLIDTDGDMVAFSQAVDRGGALLVPRDDKGARDGHELCVYLCVYIRPGEILLIIMP